jgi:hypothetical protein
MPRYDYVCLTCSDIAEQFAQCDYYVEKGYKIFRIYSPQETNNQGWAIILYREQEEGKD